MNQRAFYTCLIGISVGSLLVAYFFFPTQEELGWMYFTDNRYDQAGQIYTKLYEEGDRSPLVILPLVKIGFRLDDPKDSIDYIEKVVKENPTEREPLQYLAKMYERAFQPYNEAATLERLYQVDRSQDNLEKQIDFYKANGNLVKLQQSLELLLQNHFPTPDQYDELVLLYAHQGKWDKILNALEKMLELYPPTLLQYNSMSLLIESIQKERGTNALYQFGLIEAPKDNKGELTWQVAHKLQDLGKSNYALDLVNLLPEQVINRPDEIIFKSDLLNATNQFLEAYNYLYSHYGTRLFTDDVKRNLFYLIIDHFDEKEFKHFAKIGGLEALKENELIYLIEYLVFQEKKDLAKELANFYIQQKHPELLFEVGLLVAAAKDEEQINEALTLGKDANWTDSQKARLGKWLASNSWKEEALEFLLSIASLEDSTREESIAAIMGLLLLEQTDQAEKLASTIYDRPLKHGVNILLDALNGENIESHMTEFAELPYDIKEMLVTSAVDLKLKDLSLETSERLFALAPSFSNEVLYIRSLILNRQDQQALDLIETIDDGSDYMEELKFEAMLGLSGENPQLLQEIVNQFSDQPDRLRNIGYSLFDRELKIPAKDIFQLLAKEKDYSDPDLQMYLFLLEEDPSEDEIAWIIERSKESEGENKAGWMEILIGLDEVELAASIVQREDWKNKKIADAYMSALSDLGKKDQLEDVIAYAFELEELSDRLKKMGEMASGISSYDIAAQIYRKVIENEPRDLEARFALGKVEYFQGHLSIALELFTFCYQQGMRGEISYYMGQIFLTREWQLLGELFLKEFLCFEPEEKDVWFELLKAQSYFQIGAVESSISLYRELTKSYPKELSVWVAYANTLISMEYFQPSAILLKEGTALSEQDGDPERLEAWKLVYETKIRLLIEQGCLNEALYYALQAWGVGDQSPDEAVVIAEIYNRLGLRPQSVRWYCFAKHKQPRNEFIQRALIDASYEDRPTIDVAYESKKVGIDQKELLHKIHIQMPQNIGLKWGLGYEVNDAKADDAINLQTGLAETISVERYRFFAFCEKWFACNWRAKIAGYHCAKRNGMTLLVSRFDPLGHTSLDTEWNVPNWEFIQGVVNDGTRDQIQLRRSHRIRPRWTWEAMGALRRYHLKGFNRAASSGAITSSLNYTLWPYSPLMRCLGKDTSLSVSYIFDAEYPYAVRTKESTLGGNFQPFPLGKREFHSGVAFFEKEVIPWIKVNGFGGYVYNRFTGKGGSVYGAGLDLGCKLGLKGDLDYSHTPSTDIIGDTEDRITLSLKLVF